jgi:hypothetical protein
MQSTADIDAIVRRDESEDEGLQARQIALQERIDWIVYATFGLTEPGLLSDRFASLRLGSRPFEVVLAGDAPEAAGTDGQQVRRASSADGGDDLRRLESIVRESAEIRVIEVPAYKRRWVTTPKEFAGRALTFRDLFSRSTRAWAAGHIEAVIRDLVARELRPVSLAVIQRESQANVRLSAVLEFVAGSIVEFLEVDSVPFTATLRHSDKGLEKLAAWERCWALQRLEDAGQGPGTIAAPPKYDEKDFRNASVFNLRGKLDVPKERFISYPGCESDEDREPLYGWAGWDHLQQAQALANLYQQRKSEGWDRARVTPMLAGILELLPWVKQWHNEPSAEFDGQRLGDYFENYLDGECAAWGLSREDLGAWRPETRSKGPARGKRYAASASAGAVGDESAEERGDT